MSDLDKAERHDCRIVALGANRSTGIHSAIVSCTYQDEDADDGGWQCLSVHVEAYERPVSNLARLIVDYHLDEVVSS